MVALNDIKHKTWFNNGDEVWYHWYTMIPIDQAIHDTWHILTQWHSPTGDSNNRPDCHDPSHPNNFTLVCDGLPMQFNLRNFSVHQQPYSPCRKLKGLTLELIVVNKTLDSSLQNPENRNGGDTVWCANENIQQNQHTGSNKLPIIVPLKRGLWYEFLLHVYWRLCGQYDIAHVQNGTFDKCLNNQNGYQEMWVRPVSNTASTQNPPTYVLNLTHYNLDETYNPAAENNSKPGQVYMTQGIYDCGPLDNKTNCIHEDHVTIYHEEMEVLKCTDQFPQKLKQMICNFVK